ncbi:MAG TPA: alcohol dehydrogenase catalytic domain-containing protein [Acidimicrobiia bacterium]|jgi:L-iditol 2-dehydrogenase|nr:alcohol dehydrogenase catalytic domain-containing protein [Acidimicrobiia bacterium]
MTSLPETTLAVGKLAPGAGNLGMRTQPVRRPGFGEVTIEVLATGICGTDLHIAEDEFPSEPPVTMGHEVTGEVVLLGEGVDPSWQGARVACETYYECCERCAFCRSGRPNLCDARRSIGSRVDGGFARWLTLPAMNLWRLPGGVGRYAGALAEPLACVARCLFDPAVVNAGDRVLVVGPGTMGLLTAQAARAAGGDVTLVGLPRDRARLDLASSLGLHTVTVSGADDVGTFDVVAEASGHQGGATMAFGAVRKGGRYLQVGIFGKPIEVPLDVILYGEITLTSGNASTPSSWRRAMHLLDAGLVRLDPLVSEVVPLADWERAFDATRRGEGMKIVLDPRAN